MRTSNPSASRMLGKQRQATGATAHAFVAVFAPATDFPDQKFQFEPLPVLYSVPILGNYKCD
eukprot:5569984-Amphidinium_carterae.1